MARLLPTYSDDLFVLGILLLFLVINYNMPLASIYSHMIHIAIIMYLVPVIFNLFKWIPLSKKGKTVNEIIAGVLAGTGFIFFYNYLQIQTPMAAVFATTAFGQSETIGKPVFGLLIPTVETILFFVIGLAWLLWKSGKTIEASKLSETHTIIIGILIAGVFTFFHATAKGLANNLELMATFAFAILSIGLVIYFKSALPAILLHIVVNSYAIELIQSIKSFLLSSNMFLIVAGIGALLYYLNKQNKLKWLTG